MKAITQLSLLAITLTIVLSGTSWPNRYPTDRRGVAYSYAFFSCKHLGAGQYYLFAIRDKNGNALAGRNSYRLHVPPMCR